MIAWQYALELICGYSLMAVVITLIVNAIVGKLLYGLTWKEIWETYIDLLKEILR